MKNLQGLELSDFEKRGHIILGKAEVDRTGLGTFVELEDVKDFDISSSLVNLFQKTYALSFGITCLNTNDRYSFFNQGASKYSYVKQGRKIRLYLGIRKKDNEYYWNWFYGIIDKVSTSFNANNEICSISGRDYIAYLQENFIKNLFWGKSYSTVTIAFKEKYNMPSDCKGIYRAWSNMEGEYKEMSLNSEFTYDWEKNQLVFLYPNVPNENGNLRVQYFTNQKVENVVADLLIESGILGYAEKTSWLNSNYVTATNKTIDRIWFDKGTPYLEAINLLSERAIHRFYVNSEGMPCFRRIPVLLTENAKRMDNSEFETRLVEERVDELYNHFLIEGEKREMKKINLAVNCMAVESLVTERTGEGEEDGESSCVLVGYVSADGESSDRWVNNFGGISILSSKGFIWQKIDDDDVEIGAEQKATVSGISRLGLYILPLQHLDFDSRYKWKCWAKNSLGHYAETNWNTFITPPIPEPEPEPEEEI